ncbi:ABC transporter permease [Campylobacter lari]|nr:ABC transporter permease [Campylobacter lari]
MLLKALLKKEFLQFKRNKFLPRLVLIYPLVLILIMPWATNLEVKNINIAVIDWDKSQSTKNIINTIANNKYFDKIYTFSTYQDAKKCIENNICDAILEFNSNFERDFFKENKLNLSLYINTINGVKANISLIYINKIITSSLNLKQDKINILSNFKFNPNLNYQHYMIPALSTIVLTLLCGFLPAINIVSEKEKGNIEQINVSPISKFNFILAKLIMYWIIGIVAFSICLLVSFFVYDLYPKSNVLLLCAVVFIYILAISGFGIIISNYSNTIAQAMFVIFFFMMIFILMSGLFTSILSMPKWAYALSHLNPLKYFIESLRMIFLKEVNITNLYSNFIILGIFAIIFNCFAIISYKKRS